MMMSRFSYEIDLTVYIQKVNNNLRTKLFDIFDSIWTSIVAGGGDALQHGVHKITEFSALSIKVQSTAKLVYYFPFVFCLSFSSCSDIKPNWIDLLFELDANQVRIIYIALDMLTSIAVTKLLNGSRKNKFAYFLLLLVLFVPFIRIQTQLYLSRIFIHKLLSESEPPWTQFMKISFQFFFFFWFFTSSKTQDWWRQSFCQTASRRKCVRQSYYEFFVRFRNIDGTWPVWSISIFDKWFAGAFNVFVLFYR